MAEKAVGDGVRRRSAESKAKKERDTSSVFDLVRLRASVLSTVERGNWYGQWWVYTALYYITYYGFTAVKPYKSCEGHISYGPHLRR